MDNLEEPEEHVILTERLRLRTLRVSHAATLLRILLSREEVVKWTTIDVKTTLPEAEAWTRTRATGPGVFNFVIELRDGDSEPSPTIIGVVGAFGLPAVGYMVAPEYAGQGFATEAFSAMLAELFQRMPTKAEGGYDHLEGWVEVGNAASRQILEKCGFTLCEIRPDLENINRGPREIAIYCRARAGKTLKELGLLPPQNDEEPAPPPPIQ